MAAEAAAEERVERVAPEVVHRLKRIIKRAADVFLLCALRAQVHFAGDTVYGFLIIHGCFILAAFFAFHKSKLLSKRITASRSKARFRANTEEKTRPSGTFFLPLYKFRDTCSRNL